jgi:hypothetical protein
VTRATLRAGALVRPLAFTAVVACHAARPAPSPASEATINCEPPRGSLPATATADGLAGSFRLHIVATTGPTPGRWVEGALSLAPVSDPAERSVVVMGTRDPTSAYALAGAAELDPASLGAASTGDLSSTDPAAPGVLVIERHPGNPGAGTEIILRLGAEANRRERLRYDGGYFALLVRGIGPRGFTGTWSSGSGSSSATGYFCAERVGEDTKG